MSNESKVKGYIGASRAISRSAMASTANYNCNSYTNAFNFDKSSLTSHLSWCRSSILSDLNKQNPNHIKCIANRLISYPSICFRVIAFPKVHAAETDDSRPDPATKDASPVGKDSVASLRSPSQLPKEVEVLARLFIEKETGMERVRTIYTKDHKGDYSPEIQYITMALLQTFVLTFLMRYVPVWRMARDDFIREHRGTVFRTRFEAIRRMQDQISLRAGLDAGRFSAKMTLFGASFLFLSQSIASYRNKTSVLEYSVAAGITGGIARMHLGLKGWVAGTVVGTVLGTLVGGLAYVMLYNMELTQEQRHLLAIASKLDVEKYLVGESEFQKKVASLKSTAAEPAPSS